ncbi:MAG: ATP-binding protein [Muribaculaceae bacterium]|nr:ATP-binding protein [Muribaculaceae bacterium]
MFQFLKDHCGNEQVNLILADGIFDFVVCINVKTSEYMRKYASENLPYLESERGQYADFLQSLQRGLISDKDAFAEALNLITIIGELTLRDSYAVLCKFEYEGKISHKRLLFCYDRTDTGKDTDHILVFCENVTAVFGYEDGTSRQERGAMAKQKEELQTLQKDLACLSHEIRTSANNIYGNLSLLKKKGQLKDKYLDNALFSADYLLRLINRTLHLSRMKNDTNVIKVQAVTLEELLEYPREIFGPEAADKNIKLQILAGLQVYRYLYLDREVVQQIIINLISNAIKYTEDGGRILCRISEEYLEEKRVKVSLEVQDTGIGMDETFLAKNFSAFSAWKDYAREGRKKDVSGSGLGLSLTKRMVEALHGSIRIVSQIGKGTGVFVEFEADGDDVLYGAGHPWEDTGEQIEAEEITPIPDIRRVLAAEDEEAGMDVLCGYLEQLGIIADRAYSGKEVIECFVHAIENYYDAILMDINMPEGSGMEVARTIRGLDRKDSSLPIIAVTADMFDEEKDAVSAGISGYITKPYRIEDIISALSKYKE